MNKRSIKLPNPVNDWTSLQNIISHWHPELKDEGPKDAQIVLVSTKIDLRDDPETLNEMKERGEKPITKEEGEKLAKEIGAKMYFETSSIKFLGVKELFLQCVGLLLSPQEQQQQQEEQQHNNNERHKRGIFQSSSSIESVDDDISTFKEN